MDQIIQKLKTFFENKKYRYATIVAGVIIFVLIIYFFNLFSVLEKIIQFGPQARVINDKPIIPKTERINFIDGRIIQKGDYNTPLVPKNEGEKVVVVKAKLTLKGSYDSSVVKATEWIQDAKLVFIKSLGAVDLGGKSSQWQIIFGSKTKKAGYEIIIQEDRIISQKEIKSDSFGYDLPSNLIDSDKIISILQILPHFSDATVSAVSLYYNTDGKVWRYILATSRGPTSTSAQ